MQKGQTQVLILAGIVVLIALAGGIFYLGRVTAPKPQPSSTPSPTTIPDETANWKIYTNNQLGYTFKYSYNLSIKDEPPSSGEITRQELRDTTADLELIVSVQDKVIDQERLNGLGVNEVGINKSFNNINGTLYSTSGTGVGGSRYRQDFVFNKNNYYFWIILSTSYKDLNTTQTEESANKIFDQILSTFRFD